MKRWCLLAKVILLASGVSSASPPDPPGNLIVVAIGNGRVTVAWDSSADVDILRYRIYLGTSPNTIAQFDSTYTRFDTSKTVAGLINGTRYYFRVTAINSAYNESGYSNQVSAVPSIAPFENTSASLTGVVLCSAAWGDYDNDGDLDLLLAGNSFSGNVSKVYRNDNGNFVDISANLVGIADGSVAWGDYDNDGDLDILLSGRGIPARASKIYRNDRGNLVDTDAFGAEAIAGSASWADFDNDGDLDVLLSGEAGSGAASRLYRNDSGSFVPVIAPLEAVSQSFAAWGDYDGDGDLDVLLTGYSPRFNVSITKLYRNNEGSFDELSTPLSAVYYASVAWGDYDSDGDLDILLSGIAGSLAAPTYVSQVYRNDRGTFVNIYANLIGIAYGSSSWGDYDNDGDLDILLTGLSRGIEGKVSKVYRNDGGWFVDISAYLPRLYRSCGSWGDYDRDGDLDIVLAGEIGRYPPFASYIFQNNIETSNTAPTPPTYTMSSVTGNFVTLSWDLGTDAQTTQRGLTYNLRVGNTLAGIQILSPMAELATGHRRVAALGNTSHNLIWTIRNLADANYYWSVQAIDNAFAGSVFTDEQVFTIAVPPSAPQDLFASPSNAKVSLVWTRNFEPDLLRYRIYSDTTTPATTLLDSVGQSSTSYVDTNVVNGITYYYRITAADSSLNESGYSAEVSATPKAPGISISSSGLSFDSVTIGLFSEASITIFSIGTDTLRVTAQEITGASPGEFSIVSGGDSFHLYPVEQHLTSIRFQPTSRGLRGAALLILNNDPDPIDAALVVLLVGIGVDRTPPHIDVLDAPTSAEAGSDVIVSASSSDEFGIKAFYLEYRTGGGNWKRLDFSEDRASVPGGAVTFNGLDYRIVAIDSSDNKVLASNGEIQFFSVSVSAQPGALSHATRGGTLRSAYQLFSVPLDLAEKAFNSFFSGVNDLGSPGIDWRFFELKDRIPTEFDTETTTPLRAGAAYLLTTRRPKSIQTTEGRTNRLADMTTIGIPLSRGWNLVGNPMPYNIKLTDLEFTPPTGDSLASSAYYWTGSNGWTQANLSLLAWEGLAIRVSDSSHLRLRSPDGSLMNLTLLHSPEAEEVPALGTPQVAHTEQVIQSPTNNEWLLHIVGRDNETADTINYLGVKLGASDEYDQFDMYEPPILPEVLALYFDHTNWEDKADIYTADIRSATSEGHIWNITIVSNAGATVVLSFNGVGTIPSEFGVFAVLPDNRMVYNLRTQNTFEVANFGGSRIAKVLVGIDAFINARSEGIALTPTSFALYQNYPNPFNASTTIRYQLPVQAHVLLKVYDTIGQEVCTLMDQQLSIGYYEMMFPLENTREISTGLYLYRIAAGDFTEIKKMLLIK